MKKKDKKPKKVWEPFEPAVLPEYTVEELMKKFEVSREDAEQYKERMKDEKVFMNNLYQVNIIEYPELFHVSVKRLDKHPVHDWRHLQRIKNELIGKENEG